MAIKKVRDIAPPKVLSRQEERVKESPHLKPKKPGKHFRFKQIPALLFFGILFVVIGGAFGVGILHVFFAKGELLIWPAAREVTLQEAMRADLEREAFDPQENLIPAKTLFEEEKATRLFPASKTKIKEEKAQGTIRVFNAYSSSPLPLLSQTRFVSEEGKLFRAPAKITIPGVKEEQGKLIPGFLDVEVQAAEPGEEYNIGPSNFSLPGLSGSPLYTAVYAKSSQAMSGGKSKEVSVVSEEDIEKAKETLVDELSEKAKRELLQRVPEDMLSSPEAVFFELGEASSLVKEGAEIDQFNVTVSLKATVFLFPRADLMELAKSLLQEKLEQGERLFQESIGVDFADFVKEEGETLSFQTLISGVFYQYVDPTELKIKIRGKSKAEVIALLLDYPEIEKSSFAFWPFWVSAFPKDVDRIQVQGIIDGQTISW